jgi:hypothetical protein
MDNFKITSPDEILMILRYRGLEHPTQKQIDDALKYGCLVWQAEIDRFKVQIFKDISTQMEDELRAFVRKFEGILSRPEIIEELNAGVREIVSDEKWCGYNQYGLPCSSRMFCKNLPTPRVRYEE